MKKVKRLFNKHLQKKLNLSNKLTAMKRINLIFMLFASFFSLSGCKKYTGKLLNNHSYPYYDSTQYSLFRTAIDCTRFERYFYLVIFVQNQNTGEIKELCNTTAFYYQYKSPLLLNKTISDTFTTLREMKLIKENKNRLFKIKDRKELKRIDFYNYKKNFAKYEKIIDFKSLKDTLKKCNNIYLCDLYPGIQSQSHSENCVIAHLLIKHGFLVCNAGWSGNIMVFGEKYLNPLTH